MTKQMFFRASQIAYIERNGSAVQLLAKRNYNNGCDLCKPYDDKVIDNQLHRSQQLQAQTIRDTNSADNTIRAAPTQIESSRHA